MRWDQVTPVGTWQTCSPHRRAALLGDKGAGGLQCHPHPTTWWSKGENSPTTFLHYLKYYMEVIPVSQNYDQTPGSLLIRETGRVVELIS